MPPSSNRFTHTWFYVASSNGWSLFMPLGNTHLLHIITKISTWCSWCGALSKHKCITLNWYGTLSIIQQHNINTFDSKEFPYTHYAQPCNLKGWFPHASSLDIVWVPFRKHRYDDLQSSIVHYTLILPCLDPTPYDSSITNFAFSMIPSKPFFTTTHVWSNWCRIILHVSSCICDTYHAAIRHDVYVLAK